MFVTGRFDAGALGPEGKPSQGLTTKGQQEPPEGPLRGEQCQSTSRRAQGRTTTQEQTRAVERTKEPGEASGQAQVQTRKPPEGQTRGHRGPTFRGDEGQLGTDDGRYRGTGSRSRQTQATKETTRETKEKEHDGQAEGR